jgi:NDP-sugar pyrophosphorylase family protein
MQTVIFAGGLGTRLRPFTYEIPKVMIPVREKPFLEYILKLLKKNGLDKIVLCIGYLGKQIEDYFENGRSLGIDIRYSYEDENKLLGTGGALKNAEQLLDDEFVVLNGDTFLDINYQDLISFFHEKGKMGVLAGFLNNPKIMPNNMEIDGKNKVINYNKEMEIKNNCVDAGVSVFKKNILNLISENKKVSLETEIYPLLIRQNEFFVYPTDRRFYDVGTFERLKIFSQII